MLQRIQTIFLLLAVVATSLSFVFPIAVIDTGGKITAHYTVYGLKALDAADGGVIIEKGFVYIAAAAVLLLLLVIIFQFKNRSLQVKLCRLTYLVILAQLVMAFLMPDSAIKTIKFAGEIKIAGYGIGLYAPIAALASVFIAERFILKDEKLVKSADRLR